MVRAGAARHTGSMATFDDVRAIALSLPETHEAIEGHGGGAMWRTKNGGFVWERGPRKSDLAALEKIGREWPDGPTAAVRTDGNDEKEALLASFPDVFFTIPHFDGFPAVLLRLDAIGVEQLREVITDAWIVKAPKRLARDWLAAQGLGD